MSVLDSYTRGHLMAWCIDHEWSASEFAEFATWVEDTTDDGQSLDWPVLESVWRRELALADAGECVCADDCTCRSSYQVFWCGCPKHSLLRPSGVGQRRTV